MIDLVSAGGLAQIIERTSSTPETLRAVQLSLAPAFLLVGIGSIMNVMMARLNWIAGRIERLSDLDDAPDTQKVSAELQWLTERRAQARSAIVFSTAAAVVISVVIAVLFTSVYIETKIGTAVAFLWVLTMGLLITALVQFLREALLAARGAQPDGS